MKVQDVVKKIILEVSNNDILLKKIVIDKKSFDELKDDLSGSVIYRDKKELFRNQINYKGVIIEREG